MPVLLFCICHHDPLPIIAELLLNFRVCGHSHPLVRKPSLPMISVLHLISLFACAEVLDTVNRNYFILEGKEFPTQSSRFGSQTYLWILSKELKLSPSWDPNVLMQAFYWPACNYTGNTPFTLGMPWIEQWLPLLNHGLVLRILSQTLTILHYFLLPETCGIWNGGW